MSYQDNIKVYKHEKAYINTLDELQAFINSMEKDRPEKFQQLVEAINLINQKRRQELWNFIKKCDESLGENEENKVDIHFSIPDEYKLELEQRLSKINTTNN